MLVFRLLHLHHSAEPRGHDDGSRNRNHRECDEGADPPLGGGFLFFFRFSFVLYRGEELGGKLRLDTLLYAFVIGIGDFADAVRLSVIPNTACHAERADIYFDTSAAGLPGRKIPEERGGFGNHPAAVYRHGNIVQGALAVTCLGKRIGSVAASAGWVTRIEKFRLSEKEPP